MSAAFASLLAALAAVLLLPRRATLPATGRGASTTRAAVVSLVALVLFTSWAWLDVHDFVLVGIAVTTAAAVLRTVKQRRESKEAERRGEQVLEACEAIASDLMAGQPPMTALGRAVGDWPELAPVSAAGRMGADVPAAFREVAQHPGARELVRVAATWQVAHDTGSGLAAAMQGAAQAIRAERRTSRLVATELAAAHATARMLAVLPLGVLLLGMGIGGDPWGFLLDSTAGLIVLSAGLGLSFAGMSWLGRIANGVLRR